MKFERSTDWELIKSVMTHPKIWPHITDDFAVKVEAFEPINHESAWYVLVKDGEELLGLFALYPENRVCWKVHTCLLPNAWGRRARQAAREGVKWVFDNTECLRLITDVPEYNILAYRFAQMGGMVEFGKNPRSYMKNGQLQNVFMLGVSKEAA